MAGFIRELAQDGCIVLIATHDTGLISHLDAKLFLMQNGTIVESCATDAYASGDYPQLQAFLK